MLLLLFTFQFDYSKSQNWKTVKTTELDSDLKNFIKTNLKTGMGQDGKVTVNQIQMISDEGERYRVEFKIVKEYLGEVNGVLKVWVKKNFEIVSEGMNIGGKE
ncbi:Hypothetical_protein [Hexamita inflata]|uniref:Hypothetical_protein n=1 Tax=Hexamita inflata TaxID=28002 RepID=A0AA86RH79_9EUKA|nr:Hypothetical protein HINF_LOCUS62368 [Hexamita inflata]